MWLLIIWSCQFNVHECTIQKKTYSSEHECETRKKWHEARFTTLKTKTNRTIYCQNATTEEEETP